MPRNSASALGEAVGKLFEEAVREALRSTVESRGYNIRPQKLRNGTGNDYQIDAVIFDSDDRPVIMIDPKYIRYTKHNRDKGSWLCVAHYNLRKSHPTIRKSIAVLAGRWSAPSQALMESFGVELFHVTFERVASVLRRYGVEFDWPENAAEPTASTSLDIYEELSNDQRFEIGSEMVSGIADGLQQEVAQVLDTDVNTIGSRVSEVEVLLKTNQGEMILSSYSQVTDALAAMTQLVSDRPDIRDSFS
ncbi:MAG: DUF234 domain-containing protein [Dehalococcoidia bacterium]|nr:DUF234 domain-containing protein [Dehalococcoidia bacterium]